MSQFSSDASVSLDKSVNSNINPPTDAVLIEEIYEIPRCIAWIQSNNFTKVCLQFPDHLLPDSAKVAQNLERKLHQTIYILADTAFESCCIDYVAAAHVNADAIIHYGPICFSPTSGQIPYLYIYEKEALDIDKFQQNLSGNLAKNVIILLDTGFVYLQSEIEARFPDNVIKRIDMDDLDITNTTTVFICGRNSHRKLPNLKFSHRPKSLYFYDVISDELINYEQDERILKRRYFLIEKIKDSNTIGIVIGTLGVKNYLQAIERIKKLIKRHNKKYYLISVGKPTVAKLANFPEIDIYVIVTCALSEIYDSREYYKPIVTLYDVEMALNQSNDLNFTYNYNDVITRPVNDISVDSCDVSLLSGKVRGGNGNHVSMATNEIALKDGGVVSISTHGAGFLAGRSWKGLEQELGNTEVNMAVEGRCGIAQQYNEEPIN